MAIRNLDLDLPSQVEFNRQKNLEQDNRIDTLNSQVSELLAQAPAGFLPRVYYGLTRGDQKYRFTSGSLIATAPSGDAVGTAYQLLSTNESSNDYIPAVCVKVEDELFDCKIVIPGDYNYTSTSFFL